MKRIQLHKTLAVAAAMVLALAGGVFAQAVPSLVTQQMRLSTGGATPNYVQIRAITGAAASANYYQLDQAPTPTAGTNYSLWLNDQNQIVRSQPFGAAQSSYLLQVNATGNGLQWVDPAALTTLGGDVEGPVGNDSVNVGHSGLNNRLIQSINHANGYDGTSLIAIDRGGTNSNAIPTAGAVAYGDGTEYKFTGVGTNRQVLISQGAGTPIWSDIVGGIFNVNNGLSKVGDSVIQWGGSLIQNTTIDQAGFTVNFNSASTAAINFGSGTNDYNMTVDVGPAGNLTLNHIATDTTAVDILALDNTGHVRQRALTSLVTADNGLIVSGNNNVSMGSPATGGAPLLTDRFISLAGHTINYEGASGTMNFGTGGDVNVNVNTGSTGNLNIKGNTFNASTGINNIMWADSATGNVRQTMTNQLARNDAPALYLTLDAAGNIIKSIGTNSTNKGQIAGNGGFQYTSPAMNIQAGASITVTVQNTTGITGAIVAQVTAVTTGAAGTFSVETSESVQTGSFINYVVMNP